MMEGIQLGEGSEGETINIDMEGDHAKTH